MDSWHGWFKNSCSAVLELGCTFGFVFIGFVCCCCIGKAFLAPNGFLWAGAYL